MPRKMAGTLREHATHVSDYLSEFVTKPNEKIEAYVALLEEMEAAGDSILINKHVEKSYKDSAGYLRTLISFSDRIGKPDAGLQSETEGRLKSLMANVTPAGYTTADMNSIISEATRLLVSYIMLQADRTKALQSLIAEMEKANENVLLRHGSIRKSYNEAVSLLKGLNTDQLKVQKPDPVVTRKIQLKLTSLMQGNTPNEYQLLMHDVIRDVTAFLAVRLLKPHVIKVCRCMKNVFVQCELWCDEMLRRMSRPCCTCSRHINLDAVADVAPDKKLRLSPNATRALATGTEIRLTECPVRPGDPRGKAQPCPASNPAPGCRETTASFLLHTSRYHFSSPYRRSNSEIDNPVSVPLSAANSTYNQLASPVWLPAERTGSFLKFRSSQTESSLSFHTPENEHADTEPSVGQARFDRNITLMPAIVQSPWSSATRQTEASKSNVDCHETNPDVEPVFSESVDDRYSPSCSRCLPNASFSSLNTLSVALEQDETPSKPDVEESNYGPMVSTDDMTDWHALMISLMWNVEAWRDWIQENMDKALELTNSQTALRVQNDESWKLYYRKVTTEALQWRHYNNFSRQLTQRLAIRYCNKKIVSPSRDTEKTDVYFQCHDEMIKVINIFNKWTHWLVAVVKETDTMKPPPECDLPLHEVRWNYYKFKVTGFMNDWNTYNNYLKTGWVDKYRVILSEWLPKWRMEGPVWVMSACGVVPSGAVAAGYYEGEVIWIARTTHKSSVLPAALQPSKHCCILYAEGQLHYYTRYQVMCNAQVSWVAWRAGRVCARAVCVAPRVHVGRVLYRGSHLIGPVKAPAHRCHVVIFGRQFAFSCYELLILNNHEE